MKRVRYFAYGSNLSTRQMRRRCPGATPSGVAVLTGHRLAFTRYSATWGGGVADVVGDDENWVWGLLYELTADDLARLDGYEGGYDRLRIAVQDAGGSVQRPWTYRVAEPSAFTPPTAEYVGLIRTAAEEFGFPASYRRMLDAIPTAGR